MTHLLNLLAAIALLVWGTHIVRTGMLRVLGENLRHVLSRSFGNRFAALLAGVGVTSLVQSSTATCLMLASFAGKGLVATGAALAVMLAMLWLLGPSRNHRGLLAILAEAAVMALMSPSLRSPLFRFCIGMLPMVETIRRKMASWDISRLTNKVGTLSWMAA